MDFKEVALNAANAAAEIQLKYFGKVKRAKQKDFFYNIVTAADKECEKKIISIIKKEFPDHAIIAEESGGVQKNSEYHWIIDPLDGTTNFSHAYPHFCVSIALQKTFSEEVSLSKQSLSGHHKRDSANVSKTDEIVREHNETILGIVLDPCLKELFIAEKGKGAFLNGKKISVSKRNNLNNCIVSTGFWYDRGKYLDLNLENMKRVMRKTQGVRRSGAAALDLAYVAAGRLDAHWEFNLQPWDTAAGALLVEEADGNGKVVNSTGARYSPFDKFILASNGLVHEELFRLIKFE